MSNLIISKKANSSSKVMGILSLLLLVVGVYLAFTAKPPFAASDFEEAVTYLAPAAVIISGVLVLGISLRANKGYISVYDDHIEGYGSTGLGANGANFYFKKEDGYVASVDRSALIINCKGASYRIILGSNNAMEIYRCITGKGENTAAKKAPYQNENTTAQKKNPEVSRQNEASIRVCPRCGAKCRVPAGKGKIKIKCPVCSENFIEST